MIEADILIVEDDVTILQLERKILESEGYTVDTAGTAEEGLQKLVSNKYRLIITDIMMPGMDGYEFTKILKDPKNNLMHVPVIMVTAKHLDTDVKKGLDSGAFTYLIKPFTRETLMRSVKMVLPNPKVLKKEERTAPVPVSEIQVSSARKAAVEKAREAEEKAREGEEDKPEEQKPKEKSSWFKKIIK